MYTWKNDTHLAAINEQRCLTNLWFNLLSSISRTKCDKNHLLQRATTDINVWIIYSSYRNWNEYYLSNRPSDISVHIQCCSFCSILSCIYIYIYIHTHTYISWCLFPAITIFSPHFASMSLPGQVGIGLRAKRSTQRRMRSFSQWHTDVHGQSTGGALHANGKRFISLDDRSKRGRDGKFSRTIDAGPPLIALIPILHFLPSSLRQRYFIARKRRMRSEIALRKLVPCGNMYPCGISRDWKSKFWVRQSRKGNAFTFLRNILFPKYFLN